MKKLRPNVTRVDVMAKLELKSKTHGSKVHVSQLFHYVSFNTLEGILQKNEK